MFINFDPPGSLGTRALGINEEGLVTGFYVVGGAQTPEGAPTRGFVRHLDGTFTTFDAPVVGPQNMWPGSINRRGVVAGGYEDEEGTQHGFVRAIDGSITSFDPPGSLSTGATDINEAGMITGQYTDAGGSPGGFVRAPDGTITTLDIPGYTNVLPSSINDAGVITGTCNNDATWLAQGFLLSADGTFTAFDIPDANLWLLAADSQINAAGVVAGWYIDLPPSGIGHGFVRAVNGDVTTFDAPAGFTNIEVHSINRAGVIAGYYYGAGNLFHGYLRLPGGALSALDDPDAGNNDIQGTTPVGINKSGMVTGSFIDSKNIYHGFLTDGLREHPCRAIRDQIMNLNPRDFPSLADFFKAREALICDLEACERSHGRPHKLRGIRGLRRYRFAMPSPR